MDCPLCSRVPPKSLILSGRDLGKSLVLSPAQSGDSLWSSQVHKRNSQLDLENLPRWRLCNFPGQPVPLPDCPHRGKCFFLVSGLNRSCLDLRPVLSFPPHPPCCAVRSLPPLLEGLAPCWLWRWPLSPPKALSSPGWAGPAPVAFLQRCSCPTVWAALPWACSGFTQGFPALRVPKLYRVSNKCWAEGIIVSLDCWLGSCSCTPGGCRGAGLACAQLAACQALGPAWPAAPQPGRPQPLLRIWALLTRTRLYKTQHSCWTCPCYMCPEDEVAFRHPDAEN